MLLSAEKITKSYSEKKLIEDISFYLSEGDKVGVVGINGTGKSTFLKLLAQTEEPDNGSVTRNPGVRVELLPQNPILADELTVLEQVFLGSSQQERGAKDYEAKTILTKLGITEFDKPVGFLSGGQKKRVAMASALICPCEVLILDEPTNHLDNETVGWLENYLLKYTGAMVMVTHDRYFLERVVGRIVELEDGNLYSYPGNYEKYLELKAQREEMTVASERKRQSLLKKELAWIQRGARARSTKSKGRIERFEKLSEAGGSAKETNLEMSSLSARLGKKTIELENISKAYDGRSIVRSFSHIIARDARIGVVGRNGCGKSTLLNIISGNVLPDSGVVSVGDTVKIGYFTQDCARMDPNMRVIDYIKGIAELVNTPEGTVTASQMLEKFLFPPEQQYTQIGRISGGEKRRLYLLGILMGAPNILLLDEPTNDLDIQTLTVLEEYLMRFSGAVVAVSHDRYFLDKVVDTIFEFKEDGNIRSCLGDYSDYLKQREDEAERISTPAKEAPDKKEKSSRKKKLTYSEQRELTTIDAEIAALEEQVSALAKRIELESSNYIELQKLMAQKEETEKALDGKTERWVYLNELAQEIEQEKNT